MTQGDIVDAVPEDDETKDLPSVDDKEEKAESPAPENKAITTPTENKGRHSFVCGRLYYCGYYRV